MVLGPWLLVEVLLYLKPNEAWGALPRCAKMGPGKCHWTLHRMTGQQTSGL